MVLCICTQMQSRYETMPVIHMFAISSSTSRDTACYECPVYTKPSRGNSITAINLKTTITPAHCVVRSVALLCATK